MRAARATFVILGYTAGSALAQPCGLGITSIDFGGDSPPISLVGDATIVHDSGPAFLRLTPNSHGQRGAAWLNAAKLHVEEGFKAEFTFRLTGSADGFAVVFQNEGLNALGGSGGALGYGSNGVPGITHSLAIEFDTFGVGGEVPTPHVSLQTRGDDENSTDDDASIAHAFIDPDVINIVDGSPHAVRIEEGSELLEVFLDGFLILSVDETVHELPNILDASGCIFVGFTAATGAATADQDILAVSVDESFRHTCVPTGISEFVPGQTVTEGDSVTFHFTGTGSSPLRYKWYRFADESHVINDGGRFSGATTDTLTITGVTLDDAGEWDYQVANPCSGSSTGFSLEVTPLCPCSADFDQSGGTPDAVDIDAFFTAWLAGDPGADADCSGGTPDALDIYVFFQEWLAGGC